MAPTISKNGGTLMTLPRWNAGMWLTAVMAAEDLIVAAAFLYNRDVKHACYWFFAGCITATTMWF